MKAATNLFGAVLRTVLAGLLLAVVSAASLGYLWVLRPLAERSADDFAALLEAAGFSRLRQWTDERGWFAVFLARA